MINTKDKIRLLASLGEFLQDTEQDEVQMIVHKAVYYNKWFTPESVVDSLKALSSEFLDQEKLTEFCSAYDLPEEDQLIRVGMVLAGNIPAVGWHDLLCTFLTGNVSIFKPSEKDNVLIPYFVEWMKKKDERVSTYFESVDKLKDMDAVIATGSNNSARYFESYFGKYPHIIRKNRNAVAVLDGTESDEMLYALASDIFTHFGLGCRNASKIFVPKNYSLEKVMDITHTYNKLILHPKYKNNFDYNIAFYMLNRRTYVNNGALIMMEDENIASRIATVHYEYYDSKDNLEKVLLDQSEKIQCIVAKEDFGSIETIPFGKAQQPGLKDFADGIDTMQFLIGLSSTINQ